MSADIHEKVAKALFQADDMVAKPDFAWGETTAASYAAMADAAIAAHLEALKAAGYTVARVPADFSPYVVRDGQVWDTDINESYSPLEAEILGERLLAAAAAASVDAEGAA